MINDSVQMLWTEKASKSKICINLGGSLFKTSFPFGNSHHSEGKLPNPSQLFINYILVSISIDPILTIMYLGNLNIGRNI